MSKRHYKGQETGYSYEISNDQIYDFRTHFSEKAKCNKKKGLNRPEKQFLMQNHKLLYGYYLNLIITVLMRCMSIAC